jgi:dolichol-phosphate mannosyltransferase
MAKPNEKPMPVHADPPTLDLSLVIPLYNEEDNVANLVEEACRVLEGRDFEIVLVDDGSTDATVARIPIRPNVRVIEFVKNAGQSAAM